MSEDTELRDAIREVVKRHDPDADSLRHIAADLNRLADRYEMADEVI